ncbi:MAG: thioredoxin family protein [Candidatus Micrarchaeota archaeon]
MNPILVEVLTSPDCPHSPRALKIAKHTVAGLRAPVIVREISVATEEGRARAQEFEIAATPTITINGRIAYVGVPTSKKMLALLDYAIQREKESASYFF